VTYIWAGNRWAYLAVVVELYARKPAGWTMSLSPDTELTAKALSMAFEARGKPNDLLAHCDQGSHYTSQKYRQLHWRYQIKHSMSRRGNCWDTVTESFFGSLKQERVHWGCYQARLEPQQDVLNYIPMFHNSYRLHSYLGYMSPNQYKAQMAELKKTA